MKTDCLETIYDDIPHNGMKKNAAPMIWRRLAIGVKITDLLPIHFDEVVDIILKYYVTENVVFKNTKFLEDAESIAYYKERLLVCMKDRCSVIAVKEQNDEIVGVLLLKAVKKLDHARTFSKVDIRSGKTFSSILKFMNAIERKVDVFEQFRCNIYLRFYLLCVIPEYRRQLIGFETMVCMLDIAKYLGISVIMGIVDNHKLQDNCRQLGFNTICETNYRKYHDEDQLLIFCDCGTGDYTCALMVCVIPPDPDPISMKKVAIIDKGSKKKKNKTKKK